jgi:hypothetical protein
MATTDTRRIRLQQHFALLERVLALSLAIALAGAIALEAAPAVSLDIAIAFGIVILAAVGRRITEAALARRADRTMRGSRELAELRRQLAALPETSHPLGF